MYRNDPLVCRNDTLVYRNDPVVCRNDPLVCRNRGGSRKFLRGGHIYYKLFIKWG